jgi:hypothetical protein
MLAAAVRVGTWGMLGEFIGYGRDGSFITDAGTHPVKVLTQHV